MKKGTVVEGTVVRVEFPNKALVRIDENESSEAQNGKLTEQYVSVKDGVEGQKVAVRITKKKSGRHEGRIEKVLERSELECEPKCPHFASCGGCTYQNLPYDAQLLMKERQVREMMDAAVSEPYIWDGISASPKEDAYRNKMEFSFGDAFKDGPLTLGMHKKGSFHDVVTVDECRIVDEDFRKILRATLDFAEESRLPHYHKMRHTGYFRHLLVRKGEKTKEILVDLITTTEYSTDLGMWVQKLKSLSLDGQIMGILNTYNNSLADAVIDEGTKVLYGQDFICEELLGLNFKITPFSFFQTNSLGAEVLYKLARDYVGNTKDKIIFDLYSGTGTIAQMLASVAGKVIGVEIVPEAVQSAKENAERNGLQNCSFWCGDVLKVVEELGEAPDIIVLDPPRDGVHPKALEKIIGFGAEKIIYIACKPTSLARDLEMLQGRGYQVERIGGADLFPFTVHVETVVKLVRKTPDAYIDLKVDMDELDLTASEAKATYQEIKRYILDKYDTKVSNLYIAQVKEKYGIIERENYNKPKSENAKQPQCPMEKVEMIEEALQHFKMI